MSCQTTYYQICEVSSNDVAYHNGELGVDAKDFHIAYNLWSEDGYLNFSLYNRTERNMYVILNKSSFIRNEKVFDYYSNTYESVLLGLETMSLIKTVGQVPVICIPPRSRKQIKGFALSPDIITFEDRLMLFPKDSTNVIVFAETNSPLRFRNRIAYSFDEDLASVGYVDNTFWVSSICNYTLKTATCIKGESSSVGKRTNRQRTFKACAPNRFYKRYGKSRKIVKNEDGSYSFKVSSQIK